MAQSPLLFQTSLVGAAVTRRHLLTAAGAGAIRAAWPAAAYAQATDEAWTILRARQPGAAVAPELRVRRGEEVKVRLVNALPQDAPAGDLTLHWHGVRLANAMDGVPHLTQAPVKVGESFDYRFLAPDAGTYWYHPLAIRGARAGMGLFGALVVAETERVEADRDMVLMLGDGDDAANPQRLTVNGRTALDIPVKAYERLRLRLINAAATEAVALRFDQHRAIVMAIDGQPAEPFAPRDSRMVLAPGNRADVFIDMALAPGADAPLMLATTAEERVVARFIYEPGPPRRAAPLPDPKPLPANPLPARIDLRNAQRQNVPLAAGAKPWIDGGVLSAGHIEVPLFSVKRGRAVVMAFTNQSELASTVHLHGHCARLLDNLDDGWKPFWLDTIVVAPRQTARIAFVADNPGKWLIEQQPLRPGDTAVVTWFEVSP